MNQNTREWFEALEYRIDKIVKHLGAKEAYQLISAYDPETEPGQKITPPADRLDAPEDLVAKLWATNLRDLANRVETHTHPVEGTGHRPDRVRTGPPYPDTSTCGCPADLACGCPGKPGPPCPPAAPPQDDGPVEDDGIKRVSIGPLGEFAVDRFRDRRGESWEEFAQAIVAEAVELGLVVRPGPLISKLGANRHAAAISGLVSRRESIDDPRLAPLVVTDGDAMEARRVYGQEYSLRDVLSDYANRVNEARGYTEEAA